MDETGMQAIEDSVPTPSTNEFDSVGKSETAERVLLCIARCLNGFPVKFLVDSGATDCFVSTKFAKEKGLLLNKKNEKVKINLADGTMCVSHLYIK